jgi:histidine ammonia-lyase
MSGVTLVQLVDPEKGGMIGFCAWQRIFGIGSRNWLWSIRVSGTISIPFGTNADNGSEINEESKNMSTITIGSKDLTIEDIVAVARNQRELTLRDDNDFRQRIDAGSDLIARVIAEDGGVYGVTTGYGDSCDKFVPAGKHDELPKKLVRFHGCGLGDMFDDETTRGILAVRLSTLSRGYSGVRYQLLESLVGLVRNNVLPLIPQEGSVGASGDLTPLSYVAAAMCGDRDVRYRGAVVPASKALEAAGQVPLVLKPKEGLAIMNGTAAMTAIACLAFRRALYLGDMATRLTAMASLAIAGNAYHFDEKLFAVKPHPGQMLVADHIRDDLGVVHYDHVKPNRIQDPYSIRCAPHVIGVLFDAEPMLRQMIEIELNSANDNPIVDPESESIFHGGHFYGGHIAFAMDSLKNIVANIADLLDRQLAILVDEKFNRGLPPNLAGSDGEYALNHGFKAVQIGVSAWTAEALKNTMPASVFSRSTECHNQDKVSMGTIAARDCIRVLEQTEQVAAACLLAYVQALDLREAMDSEIKSRNKSFAGLRRQIRTVSPFLSEDRPLESELRAVLDLIASEDLEIFYGR